MDNNMTTTPLEPIRFKVTHQGETRRGRCDPTSLHSTVLQLFGLGAATLQYADSDGDQIVLRPIAAELCEAALAASETGGLLRLSLTAVDQQAAEEEVDHGAVAAAKFVDSMDNMPQPPRILSGVGAQIMFTSGDVEAVVGDEKKVWRLASGRVAKKKNEGVTWGWHLYVATEQLMVSAINGHPEVARRIPQFVLVQLPEPDGTGSRAEEVVARLREWLAGHCELRKVNTYEKAVHVVHQLCQGWLLQRARALLNITD